VVNLRVEYGVFYEILALPDLCGLIEDPSILFFGISCQGATDLGCPKAGLAGPRVEARVSTGPK
jgi:hypothetical protein